MSKINLTDEQMQTVIDALNNETEVPPELLKKLSPSFFAKLSEDAKFDYDKLDSFKIPSIEYAGKRSEAQILNQAAVSGGNAPLEVERCFSSGSQKGTDQANFSDDWQNLIVQGDNLQFLKTAYLNQDPLIKDQVKGEVKLIYIDPPFGTGDEYGSKNGENSYSAKIRGSEFIESLRERLIFLKKLLADDGVIFMRIDYHFGHYMKIVMDEIFGKSNFKNEIVINRIYKNVFKNSNFIPTATDSLFVYFRSSESEYNYLLKDREEERDGYWRHMDDSAGGQKKSQRDFFGVTLHPPKGKHFKFSQENIYKKIKNGQIRLVCKDCNHEHDQGEISHCPNCDSHNLRPEYWVEPSTKINLQSNWTDIPGYSNSTDYPTENSEQLLERIIRAGSSKGDIILDAFAGSGTTPAVAEKLGRRWIVADFGKHAIYTMQKRLLEIGDSKALGEDAEGEYGKDAEPFCVASVGAYDFSKVMNLREEQEVYTQFVCGLFNIGDVDEELSSKYNLSYIYAEKEGDPVEVYPVWDDEYLSDIKIDEEYLESIITQSPTLSGTYYIIAPESCSRVTSTVEMKNQSGGKVTFKILSFPYKVLEEFTRKQKIEEQPDTEDNINNLISSVGFYFNEDIAVSFEFAEDGLTLTDFSTEALDGAGNKFDGRDGLAMLLIDKDYDGGVFTMEEAVYAKGIDEQGEIAVDDLSDTVGIIAVDKHGNESEVIVLER